MKDMVIIVYKKDEFEQKKVANLLTTRNNSNGNSNSKSRTPKLIKFTLLIYQDILGDIQLSFR